MKRLVVAEKNMRTVPHSSHKSTTLRKGSKIDASKNPWEGELNVDSALTDIGWGAGGGLRPFPFYYYFCFMIIYFLCLSSSFPLWI